MHHADSSDFSSTTTKKEVYDKLLQEAEGLFEGQRNWVCNLANASSLLWHAYHSLPSPSNAVNWVGFYTLDHLAPNKNSLVLGPFHGRPACQKVAFGQGVCGVAAKEKRVVRVDDVEEFPGHIACDAASRSEIVVPVMVEGKVVAVIDVDCTVFGAFDQDDEDGLTRLARLIADGCDGLA